ncbi:enoyl-CoA hydratase-related protein [Aeromicrobium wangtongii]|uniref:Enoyl-CoA hydratase-related protein n=1 Tax=Aeromicrobium wangtongii TaxID=2969247 RepID=A0ABY5M8M3_9ACTN|nr:enoyl-CoA hydratase-related protein [Aeromicrobium wangtongii]MCD9199867.1 enoyl-CoA hydratase-related protein [Aeromicrobium wangtongii]UUP13486.1 enoyl-CoA hydratase-related protein [Aeromicrobium wangtongii]
MSDADPVLVTHDAGVAVLTLNRPERKNAWTVGMQGDYYGALAAAAGDPDVRAIVVTGAGGAFCPGADTRALTTYTETGTTNPLAEQIEQPEWFPSTIAKPMIAAIQGPCAGIGLVQALMCDIRVAAADARLSTAFARRGLPAMHGGEWLLERIAGAAVAHELLLTGRTFDGTEAQRLGVVHETAADPLARATQIARDMATDCSPASMAHIKQRLWTSRERSLEQTVVEVDAVLDGFLASEDFREGVTSFQERRSPQFRGLSHPTGPAQ